MNEVIRQRAMIAATTLTEHSPVPMPDGSVACGCEEEGFDAEGHVAHRAEWLARVLTDRPGAEPLLVTGMRRHPTGEVRHVPDAPVGMGGTSTAGFLREVDEWAAQIREQTVREVARHLDREGYALPAGLVLNTFNGPPDPTKGAGRG